MNVYLIYESIRFIGSVQGSGYAQLCRIFIVVLLGFVPIPVEAID